MSSRPPAAPRNMVFNGTSQTHLAPLSTSAPRRGSLARCRSRSSEGISLRRQRQDAKCSSVASASNWSTAQHRVSRSVGRCTSRTIIKSTTTLQMQRRASRMITGTGVTPIRITTGADLVNGGLSVGASWNLRWVPRLRLVGSAPDADPPYTNQHQTKASPWWRLTL